MEGSHMRPQEDEQETVEANSGQLARERCIEVFACATHVKESSIFLILW